MRKTKQTAALFMAILAMLSQTGIAYATETTPVGQMDSTLSTVEPAPIIEEAKIPSLETKESAQLEKIEKIPLETMEQVQLDKIGDLSDKKVDFDKATQAFPSIEMKPENLVPATKPMTITEIQMVKVPQKVKKLVEVEKVVKEEYTVRKAEGTIGWNDFSIDRYGTINVPATFNINPYKPQLESSVVYLANDGITDMIIYADHFESTSWQSPRVVSPDTFFDWDNLGISDTYSNIAFGLSIKNMWGMEIMQYWFNDEGYQHSEMILALSPGEAVTIEIIGKYGRCWFKPCVFSYDCELSVEVLPKKMVRDKIVKVMEEIEVIEMIEVPVEVQKVIQVPLTQHMEEEKFAGVEKAPDSLIESYEKMKDTLQPTEPSNKISEIETQVP